MATAKEQAENSIRAKSINGRPVNQYDLNKNFIKLYNSVKEAEIATGVFSTLISRVCLGKQKNAGDYIWKYVDMIRNHIPGEKWKNICYEDCESITVSNKGRVIMKNGRKNIGTPAGGYLEVSIKSLETDKFRTFRVHRLIMAAFHGENADMIVNHINGIRTDNRLENLEYLTQQDNVLHAIKTGLVPKGQKRGRKVVVTNADGTKVEYESALACSKDMGITRTVVSKMCREGLKHHEGFTCHWL